MQKVLFRRAGKGGFHMIVYREASTLARDLGIGAGTLYAVSNSLPAHYRSAAVAKKDGGVRHLMVPDAVLKEIQRRIARRILADMPVSPCAAAYRCGVGTAQNAACHVGRHEVLRLDILHFFDSVRYTAVKDAAFPPERFSEPLRVLLTMLCYYRDGLPQGAPTSPAIANLVLREFDLEVSAWCRGRGIAYTRYCDDLVFSSNRGLEGVAAHVEEALGRRGFLLNRAKTVCRSQGQRQVVTGLVVNRRVSVPAAERRRLRQEIYYCRTLGVEAHLRRIGKNEEAGAYCARLLGRVSYLLHVSPECAWARQAREWLLTERKRRE